MKVSVKWRESVLRINWIGLVAGICMLVLPFLGRWWHLGIGAGIADVAISPFDVDIAAAGTPISIPIIWYVCLGAKLTLLVSGTLMLVGSLVTWQWWSEKLVRFGSRKVLWMIIGVIVVPILGALIVNKLGLPYISGSLPYLSGSSALTLGVKDIIATLPISMTLTSTFFLAAAVAGLGIAAEYTGGDSQKHQNN